METKITEQLEKIKKGNPTLDLIKPCRINDGIQILSPLQKDKFIHLFEKENQNKKIAVTGSNGFISKHLIQELKSLKIKKLKIKEINSKNVNYYNYKNLSLSSGHMQNGIVTTFNRKLSNICIKIYLNIIYI